MTYATLQGKMFAPCDQEWARQTSRCWRWLLAVWTAILVSGSGLSSWAAEPPVNASRPNIIVLLTDDQRRDTLGCMGNSIIQTPNIDRLARDGVAFDNAFATTAICMTSRASLLTGQYARRHGIIDFSQSFTPAALQRTYPGLLKQAGYHTGCIGKWGVGEPPDGFFDVNHSFPGQGHYLVEVNGQQQHVTNLMGDQAVEFIADQPAERPFLLCVNFKAPHVQDEDPRQFIPDPALDHLYRDVTIPMPELCNPKYHAALPEFLRESEARIRWFKCFSTPEHWQQSVKAYYQLISGVDLAVGRIQQQLAERGLADNTVIVYLSDQGYYLGERGFAHKWFMHEESIRVPLIIHDPRLPETHGQRRAELALNIDLAPTLLSLAGLSADQQMQGASLLPLVNNDTAVAADWRDEFFYEHLFVHPKIPKSEGVRTTRWKYIRYIDQQPAVEELYDLESDPLEVSNLIDNPQHAAQLSLMREKWQVYRESLK